VNILNTIKGNLEAAMKFVDDTACKLRYGENYLGCSISLGSEYYIYTVEDLYSQYQQAKSNGSSEAELDAINEKIIYTEHRNNPMQLQRMVILKHLEPYRNYTFDEILQLKENELTDPDLLKVKINFNDFINRFERENMNIIEFASKIDFDKKINIIKQKLLDYAKEGNGVADRPEQNVQSERGDEGQSDRAGEERLQTGEVGDESGSRVA
jgi:hypothetical protein